MRHRLRRSLTTPADKTTYDPWEALANAIVLSAVEDFRAALRIKDKAEAAHLLRWFDTEWSSLLCRSCHAAIKTQLDTEYKEVFPDG